MIVLTLTYQGYQDILHELPAQWPYDKTSRLHQTNIARRRTQCKPLDGCLAAPCAFLITHVQSQLDLKAK